ncbi:hypothetical protein ABB07_39405 (plasmid) [Streptomyces incarnatus]|uniref:Uncharacterized protein n=1 Tax=Streptomyces incarnatus TaxID=665007 RepID=A0ABM5TXN0_9ACTN|nr:hypothetical protein [Streptomyces incarnatus]AKJ15868.1 hypothetical protein ABB07_39405 [Streptomyces incarnatus]
MDVELLPHVGVASFRLGMPLDEAMAEAEAWGCVEHSSEGGRPPGKYVVANGTYDVEFVLLFESEEKECLTGIEVWRFRDEMADIRFLLEGIDVFRTPSDDLPEILRARGHDVVESDYGFEEVTDLSVRLANNSSFEYPVDEEGDPLHYDYVLVFDKNFAST